MDNFQFYNPTRIIFGKNTENKTAKEIKRYGGSRVLLHYGGSSIKKSGLYDKITQLLSEAGIFVVELGGVVPNPRLDLVYKGIELCKENNIDFILAVGGGSVIDSAKGIAMGCKVEGDIWDYYMDNSKLVPAALPIGVVLTIPAAGSESSTGSVITNELGGFKRYTGGEIVIPKFAIMNPEITYTMPKAQIAYGCSDIIAHLFERYFTLSPNNDLTDRLIESTITTVMNNGLQAMKNPTDYNCRAEIMWAGTIAHNNLLNTGRLGDWGTHDIEHELSGIYDIAHGAGLAILFPAWMRYVHNENIDKFIQIANRVFGVDFPRENKELIVEAMIDKLESWYKSMGLPTRLSEVNIDDTHFKEMAEKCVVNRGSVGNFKKLYPADIEAIYKLAL